MSSIKHIRTKRLAVSQAAMGRAIGVTQANISHYERGQTVPPDVAARLIEYAKTLDVRLSYDDIYQDEPVAAATV
jgi:putative transcriptional regulator